MNTNKNSSHGSLGLIYCYFLHSGRARIACVENYLRMSGDSCSLSMDDRLNIEGSYQKLFAEPSLPHVEALYKYLLLSLKDASYEACADALSGLEFLQVISATALWKYRLRVGDALERFARDYDRLDVEEEKQRLYAFAQRGVTGSCSLPERP